MLLCNKLDPPSGPWRHDLTETLLEQFSRMELWDEFGIDEDVVVRIFTFHGRYHTHVTLALYMQLPSCRHPWTNFSRSPWPSHWQRNVQGLPSHMGWGILGTRAWSNWGRQDFRWDWQSVSWSWQMSFHFMWIWHFLSRIAATPLFPGLHRFKQGWCFKQWTGDDSKALMKVYLPAVVGFVPDEMVRCLGTFLNFCYITHCSNFNETTLNDLDAALEWFHVHREIFCTTAVHEENWSNLPCQHALAHFCHNIEDFGALNGICSSITESWHITAVKKPWRRSSRFKALGQMLLTNQRLDKLAATKADFVSWGMLPPVWKNECSSRELKYGRLPQYEWERQYFTLPLLVQRTPTDFRWTLPFLMDSVDSLSEVRRSPLDMTGFCC